MKTIHDAIDQAHQTKKAIELAVKFRDELIAQAREASKQKKSPLKAPRTLAEFQSLSAAEIRELMAHPNIKKQIDELFDRENRSRARAAQKAQEEQDAASQEMAADFQQRIGGSRA
jgi:uncharacterized pyridoxal phosphate-containing UPF0001 family protein